MIITLLRRIALGLPIAVGPLVVGVATGGCTHCYSLPAGSSSHPRSGLTESLVGTPASFDPTGCEDLCRMLDARDRDAGAGADAGSPLVFLTPYPERVRASCSYTNDGTALFCTYTEHFCETTASCSPATYGRTPAGLISHRSNAATALARWLADGARLEAASVPAFEDLAAELSVLGAPRALIAAAHRSAADEARHARLIGGLARRVGACIAPVQRHETALRGPEPLALDNAVEGCVHEAWAALSAALQAERASSTAVRHIYRSIAADEARHALLSFAANDWLAPKLSSSARRRTEDARHEALGELVTKLAHEPDAALQVVLGLPDASRSMDLLALVA
jgi:hypothetical protein